MEFYAATQFENSAKMARTSLSPYAIKNEVQIYMGFLKKRGKILFTVSVCLFILLQQIAVHYRRIHLSTKELVSYEINQLEKLWCKADVEDLITPEKIANYSSLKQAYARLKQVEIDIQESEKKISGLTGKKLDFLQKAQAYYRHSALALINIIEFLLAKEGKYSVQENGIFFENEKNATKFRELIEQLSYLHQEKKAFETCTPI